MLSVYNIGNSNIKVGEKLPDGMWNLVAIKLFPAAMVENYYIDRWERPKTVIANSEECFSFVETTIVGQSDKEVLDSIKAICNDPICKYDIYLRRDITVTENEEDKKLIYFCLIQIVRSILNEEQRIVNKGW